MMVGGDDNAYELGEFERSKEINNLKHCHVSHWLRRWFGLVIGFIGYLQVVTTNNY
jgi:hypothetical protein